MLLSSVRWVVVMRRTISAASLLVLASLLLTIIPITTATLIVESRAEAATYDQASKAQQQTANNIAENANTGLSEYLDAMRVIGAVDSFATANDTDQYTMMQTLRITGASYFETFTKMGTGRIRSDNGVLDTIPQYDVSVLSDSQRDIALINGNIVFLGPLIDNDEQVLGYVGAFMSSDAMVALILNENTSLKDTTQIWIVDQHGTVISGSGQPTDGWQLDGVAQQVTTNQDLHLVAHAPIPSQNWIAIVDTNEVALQQTLRQSRVVTVLAILLTACIAFLVGAFGSRLVTSPLDNLVSATKAVMVDDPPVPLHQSVVTEIMLLNRAFEEMRRRLTERVHDKEQALVLAQRAAIMREQFLSVAAHELKTPITALQGHTQLALMRLNSSDTSYMKDALDRIQIQTRRLTALIDTLLDVSRLERGQVELARSHVDLVHVITEVITQNWPGNTRIRIHPMSDISMYIDPIRVGQVVTNLVTNALKYSPTDKPVDVSIGATADTVTIEVRDYGAGVPIEIREHLFERFVQGHASSYQSGLGLGLFISKQIVELHHGTIVADFPDSGGTAITVTLPR